MKRFRKPRPGRLSLYVNGGSRRVRDGEILVGDEYQKFADEGLLVEVKESVEVDRSEETSRRIAEALTKEALDEPAPQSSVIEMAEKVAQEESFSGASASVLDSASSVASEEKRAEGEGTKSHASKLAKAAKGAKRRRSSKKKD